MNYDSMKVSDLIAECKAKNIKGYSGKKKDDIINLLKGENTSSKKELTSKQKKGQFYTVNNSYILEGLDFPICNKKIIKGEPVMALRIYYNKGGIIRVRALKGLNLAATEGGSLGNLGSLKNR